MATANPDTTSGPSSATQELYDNVPLRALQPTTRHRISLYMNLRIDISVMLKDWRGLAERIDMENIEISNLLQSSTDPTDAILVRMIHKGYTVGQLLRMLSEMEREDILADCAKLIENDVNRYKPIQVAEVSSQDTRAPITFGELNTRKPEFFDAFVSFHLNDLEFVKQLIDKLEKECGFKLCIPDRDMCIGLVENEATATLIKSRCKRTIVVLSTSYLEMPDLKAKLKWQLQVAQTLAPVADTMHKLVPIVIDSVIRLPEDVPEVLLPYNVCDYTRPTTREWFWERMELSLAAPTKYDRSYKGPSTRLGKKTPVEPEVQLRHRTHTEPANLNREALPVFHRSESETATSSNNERVYSNSRFYRPMPSTSGPDSPQRKKKWPWSKKDNK